MVRVSLSKSYTMHTMHMPCRFDLLLSPQSCVGSIIDIQLVSVLRRDAPYFKCLNCTFLVINIHLTNCSNLQFIMSFTEAVSDDRTTDRGGLEYMYIYKYICLYIYVYQIDFLKDGLWYKILVHC